MGGPVARGPTGGPSSAAHREGEVPNAAHGIAVVSRVDSPGKDLMQMHLRIPAGPSSEPEKNKPRALSQPLPVRPPDSAPRSPIACQPPPGHERLRPPPPDRRSAAEMPGCSHSLPHRRTVRAQSRGACEAGATPGCAQPGRVRAVTPRARERPAHAWRGDATRREKNAITLTGKRARAPPSPGQLRALGRAGPSVLVARADVREFPPSLGPRPLGAGPRGRSCLAARFLWRTVRGGQHR